ncbi:MAG TPA: AAA-associated domain-containing protein [Thermoplasmata archaeon]|nr:AAA-associated domain-containing protein [Thermoplasmata archaeon]
MTRNDDLWAELIQKLGLDLTRPVNFLNEIEIKVTLGGRRDLRNLVSMTRREQLAKVLGDSEAFVLPKSRTEWMIVHGKGYQTLDAPSETEDFRSNLSVRLTTLSYGRGENPFLNHALHSGLLSSFTGTPVLWETLSGRSGTPEFRFRMDSRPGLENLKVEQGTQVEIDKGYEAEHEVLLFEGKARPQGTFLIRQLYYPFRSQREFQERTGHKRVRSFIFVADPDVDLYSMWEFEWTDTFDYEAIRLVGSPRRFRIVERDVPTDELAEIEENKSIPEIQANDLEKVTTLPFLVTRGVDTAAKWAQHYQFALRQGNYYESAAAALGLVDNQNGTFVLTPEGKRFVSLQPPDRDRLTSNRLLTIPTINRVFALCRERGSEGVSDVDIARIIEETRGLRGTTPRRRASSVRAWFRWLSIATGVVVVEGRWIFSRAGWDQRQRIGRR